MAVEDAIAALREHWDDVIAKLGPEAAGELRRLVGQLDGPAREAAADQIVDILVEGLPGPAYRTPGTVQRRPVRAGGARLGHGRRRAAQASRAASERWSRPR